MSGEAAAIIVHVAAGGVALLAGATAVIARKGERVHRVAGTVFVVSMLVMAGVGGALSVLHKQDLNILASSLTIYLVGTALLAARRRDGEGGRLEVVGLAWVAAVVLMASLFGLSAKGPFAVVYYLFGAVAALAAAMDLRVIARRGLAGGDRIARHLWRMCLALAIAAAAFFLGQADEMPAAIRGPHLAAPPLLALVAMAFWLVRVRITGRRKGRVAAN